MPFKFFFCLAGIYKQKKKKVEESSGIFNYLSLELSFALWWNQQSSQERRMCIFPISTNPALPQKSKLPSSCESATFHGVTFMSLLQQHNASEASFFCVIQSRMCAVCTCITSPWEAPGCLEKILQNEISDFRFWFFVDFCRRARSVEENFAIQFFCLALRSFLHFF